MKITDLVKQAYENAKDKGWHETERSPLEYHALIHSEVSEATEAARIGSDPLYFPNAPTHGVIREGVGEYILVVKPEGELVELADVVIRIADYCGSRGWDLERAIKLKMEYNKTRPHRHGGKRY